MNDTFFCIFTSFSNLLADASFHEEEQVDQDGRKNGDERDPDGNVFFDAHRVDEPVSLVRRREFETFRDGQLFCVSLGEGLIDANHDSDRDGYCKVAKVATNLYR